MKEERTFGEIAREALESANTIEEPEQKRLLITRQKPDKHAAAERYAIVEDTLESLYTKINTVNNRELSESLLNMYDELCMLLLRIKEFEKNIIIK